MLIIGEMHIAVDGHDAARGRTRCQAFDLIRREMKDRHYREGRRRP